MNMHTITLPVCFHSFPIGRILSPWVGHPISLCVLDSATWRKFSLLFLLCADSACTVLLRQVILCDYAKTHFAASFLPLSHKFKKEHLLPKVEPSAAQMMLFQCQSAHEFLQLSREGLYLNNLHSWGCLTQYLTCSSWRFKMYSCLEHACAWKPSKICMHDLKSSSQSSQIYLYNTFYNTHHFKAAL